MIFEGQYPGEIILFKKHESIASVLLHIFPALFGITLIGTLSAYFTSYLPNGSFYTIIIIICFTLFLGIYLFIIRKFYQETFFIFTNKRAIKSVRSGLFSSHLKELKNEHIRQITSNNDGIAGKIFHYGKINIQGPESETSLYFRDISENKAIVLYISRIIDLLKKEGAKTELVCFSSN